MRWLGIMMCVVVGLLMVGQAGAADSTGWTTYLHDNSRDNAVQDGLTFASGTVHLSNSWTFKAGGPIVASPMIEGGYAYIPSWDGYLYALDLATHQLVWKKFLGTQQTWAGLGGVSSTPAFASDVGPNGAVMVGGGGQETPTGKHLYFYALDAQTGTILWKTSVGNGLLDSVFDSPLYLDGHVYIGTAASGTGASSAAPIRKGMLFELDGQTGKILHKTNMAAPEGVGGAIWGSIAASPDGTRIFVPTGDGSIPPKQPLTTAIVAVDSTTLKVVDHWQKLSLQKTFDIDFGAAITVFPDGNRTLVGTPVKLGSFFALDATKLKEGPVWSRKLGDTGDPTNRADDIESSAYAAGPEYPGGATLYAEAPDVKVSGKIELGRVYALNPATGQPYWSAPLQGTPYGGALTVYDDTVISAVHVGGSQTEPPSGRIEVHSATDGHLLASLATPVFGFASPVVQDGTIYFGTTDGVFHAISMTGSPAQASTARVTTRRL
jgi:outer membrane protein assembly factor BamB